MMKSAMACPFIAIHGRYCMSNSLNSIAHGTICPVASRLLIALQRGLSVTMITGCAWKYGLSLRVAITNAKASFSISEYLSSAPRNTPLM